MKRRLPDFLQRPRPSTQEAIFAILVIGFIVNFVFAYTDVIVHDNFVGLIVAECYPSNETEFCQKAREVTECPDNSQNCLGLRYWVLLPQLVLIVSGFTAILVMFFRILGGAKINGAIILVGIAWFITGIILPYTGWGDFTYYLIKDESIPDLLPWLDNAGLFPYINFGSDPQAVEKIDLYGLMGIGLVLLVGLWYSLTHINKKYLKF